MNYTARIECTCATCEKNAATVGATFPLAAYVDPRLAARIGDDTHGTVHAIHDPAIPAKFRPGRAA